MVQVNIGELPLVEHLTYWEQLSPIVFDWKTHFTVFYFTNLFRKQFYFVTL